MPTSHDRRRVALAGLAPRIDPETRRRLEAMSDEDTLRNAIADTDAPPSTREELERASRDRRERLASAEKTN